MDIQKIKESIEEPDPARPDSIVYCWHPSMKYWTRFRKNKLKEALDYGYTHWTTFPDGPTQMDIDDLQKDKERLIRALSLIRNLAKEAVNANYLAYAIYYSNLIIEAVDDAMEDINA